jgi:hypothetical protein
LAGAANGPTDTAPALELDAAAPEVVPGEPL